MEFQPPGLSFAVELKVRKVPEFKKFQKSTLNLLNLLNFQTYVMAGQLKEVRNRIKSVQSSQQITKAMKMGRAAKLRRAQDAIIQMRPYAQKLQEMLSNIVSNSEGGEGMALAAERPIETVLVIVITSDRGLAGACNSNTIKLAKATIAEKYSDQLKKGNLAIRNIGKKGY